MRASSKLSMKPNWFVSKAMVRESGRVSVPVALACDDRALKWIVTVVPLQ